VGKRPSNLRGAALPAQLQCQVTHHLGVAPIGNGDHEPLVIDRIWRCLAGFDQRGCSLWWEGRRPGLQPRHLGVGATGLQRADIARLHRAKK